MEQSAVEIAASVRRGEPRAVEVLDEALAAVAAGNDALGAFVHVDEGLARVAAERGPGGPSGGSAAGVAAGWIRAAAASDGGGSTRIPAAFCGLVGFKPSFGRIPHPGPHGSETSVLGVMATTVADAARHLDVTAGPDDRDRFSLPAGVAAYEQAAETLP